MVHYVKSLLPPGCDLEVCFEDQPNNDFTSLFYLALGIEESPVPFPPLSSDPGIFFSAIGRSFFDQCLPKNSVDISTSFTAVHWLSEVRDVHLETIQSQYIITFLGNSRSSRVRFNSTESATD
jgi:hypothetical protein